MSEVAGGCAGVGYPRGSGLSSASSPPLRSDTLLSPMFTPWSPARLRRVLDGRDRGELNELARYLIPAAITGRTILLARRPYLRRRGSNKEDDVQEVLVALFRDDGRILRKFDPERQRADGDDERGLRRFVIGVALNVLLRSYERRRVRWEELKEDMARIDGDATAPGEWLRLTRIMDLERAVRSLSESDRSLFSMIYVEQEEQAVCCARLGIAENTFQARKSRLIKRLRRLQSEGDAGGGRADG